MDAYGSIDNIEDALDILRAQNIYFALAVAVPGESQSRTFLSESLEEDALTEVAQEMDEILTKVVGG